MKASIAKDGRAWLWNVRRGKKVVAGGYGRTKRAAKNDMEIWLQGKR